MGFVLPGGGHTAALSFIVLPLVTGAAWALVYVVARSGLCAFYFWNEKKWLIVMTLGFAGERLSVLGQGQFWPESFVVTNGWRALLQRLAVG